MIRGVLLPFLDMHDLPHNISKVLYMLSIHRNAQMTFVFTKNIKLVFEPSKFLQLSRCARDVGQPVNMSMKMEYDFVHRVFARKWKELPIMN